MHRTRRFASFLGAAIALAQSPPAIAEAKPDGPFIGRATVTLDELVAELNGVANSLARDPDVLRDYAELCETHELEHSSSLLAEYVRVRLVFEATRDGGLWGLKWAITNREGTSRRIWKAWQSAPVPRDAWAVTAIAECDELTSLFSFLARRLGVEHAGWLGAAPFHVVAAWTARDGAGRRVRIVIPTSQVFLGRTASLGTREFDANRPKVIWNYVRTDIRGSQRLPADLARHFVVQLVRHAGRPQRELQDRRNRHGGS